MPLSTYLENVPEGFSEPKKKLLYYLKIMQQAGLEELVNVMKVSRMGCPQTSGFFHNRED